jgi:hypothetical protein
MNKAKLIFFRLNVIAATFIMVMISVAVHASSGTAQPVLFPELQEPPIILKASEVLSKDILIGPNYRIEQTVTNDGFINTYRLSTDYGPLTVESTALLLMRINELGAIEHMEKLEQTDVFKDAFKKGAKAPLNTAKALVKEPVETVKGVGTGIGRWFSDIGRAITSDDPHQEGALQTAIGYAGTKRKFSYEYGIDPYTDYKPVKEILGKISKAGVAGGITPNIAFGAIKKPVGKALKFAGTADKMKKIVRDKPPAELEKINREKLLAMRVALSVTDNFLSNHYYNPQEATMLVGYLEMMRGTAGRDKFIRVAAMADNSQVARFMRLRAQMISSYNANVSPVSNIIELVGAPFIMNKTGVVVGLFPLDHVAWTGALYQKEKGISDHIRRLPDITGKEIWITGSIDPVARKAMESRGWNVIDYAGNKLTE